MKYLRNPLSIRKLPNSALQSLVDKVTEKLLTWKGQLMQHSGCLTLIKTTLSAILVYMMTNLELLPWSIKALVKIMRAFL
jgi:hypothetical protein